MCLDVRLQGQYWSDIRQGPHIQGIISYSHEYYVPGTLLVLWIELLIKTVSLYFRVIAWEEGGEN